MEVLSEHSENPPGKRKQFSLWPWHCKAFIRLCCSRQYYIFIPKYWQDSDFSTSTAWGRNTCHFFCFLPPASPQRMMVCFMLELNTIDWKCSNCQEDICVLMPIRHCLSTLRMYWVSHFSQNKVLLSRKYTSFLLSSKWS